MTHLTFAVCLDIDCFIHSFNTYLLSTVCQLWGYSEKENGLSPASWSIHPHGGKI